MNSEKFEAAITNLHDSGRLRMLEPCTNEDHGLVVDFEVPDMSGVPATVPACVSVQSYYAEALQRSCASEARCFETRRKTSLRPRSVCCAGTCISFSLFPLWPVEPRTLLFKLAWLTGSLSAHDLGF